MALYLPRKVTPLHSLRLSLADIKKIYERLGGYVGEQATLEINALQKPVDKTAEQFEAQKKDIRERAFKITVTIQGRDGASLYGEDVAVFDSPNRPEKISGVYLTNVTAYQGVAGNRPVNSFEVNLDFSQPKLLDIQSPVSAPTPNFSNLTVQGNRDAWVASISDAVLGVAKDRTTKRAWLHKAFVYDAGLALFGFPFALFTCWELSPIVSKLLGSIHPFLSAAAYVYVVLAVVWLYRTLFGYTKWAFPLVELTDNKDAAATHRAVWLTIILGLVVNVIWAVGACI